MTWPFNNKKEEKPEVRYGMYKNFAVGKIKYVEPVEKGKRQHILVGSVEMTQLLDTYHRATSNRYLYVPKEYSISRDMVNRWCLYGFYVWSNRNSDSEGNFTEGYNTILTLRHFELLDDEAKANEMAFKIMESIKPILTSKQ